MANLFARVGVKNGSHRRRQHRLRQSLRRRPLSEAGPSPAARPSRCAKHPARFDGGPPHRLRELAHQPRQSDVRAHPRQSRLGQLHGPRPGRSDGRSARDQPRLQRRTASRPEQRFRRPWLRCAAPHPHHHEFQRLSAFERGQRNQSIGQHLLFEAHHPPPERRSDSGRHVASHRRRPPHFSGYPAGTRAQQLPDTQVKSEFLASFGRPARMLCDAAERASRPDHRAGPARDQRRHAQ